MMGAVTGAGAALTLTTGLMGGGCCFGGGGGGALFFWARHSSSIALSCSVASLLGDCKSRIALANEVSKDIITSDEDP